MKNTMRAGKTDHLEAGSMPQHKMLLYYGKYL